MVAAKAVKKVAISAAEVMAIKTTEAGSMAGLAVAAVVVVVATGAAELAEAAVIIIYRQDLIISPHCVSCLCL